MQRNLAFIDIESTGLDLERHEIIQIGCVLVKPIPRAGKGPTLEVLEEFELKIKPERIKDADPQALLVNGYNEADWIFAIDIKKALEVLAEKVKDAVMVGHNVSFDHAFLEKAFEKNGIKNTMHYRKLDTISIAYAKLYNDGDIEKFSLRALCEKLGIENKHAHTALSDARATFELYKKLLVD
ncbi:MAG: 3'-5' exonuclease [Patescibacteria group bacterium]